jgi:hypothetical protein
MHEQPNIENSGSLQPERRRFSFALILALAATVVIVVAVYFAPGRQSPPDAAPQSRHFAFGATEREYARNLQFENASLSKAENFLHQEVITLSAEVVNGGQRSLRGVEVTIEFFDNMNQIALRETRAILSPGAASLAPSERRAFEISFEHISASWNGREPILRVTGLEF